MINMKIICERIALFFLKLAHPAYFAEDDIGYCIIRERPINKGEDTRTTTYTLSRSPVATITSIDTATESGQLLFLPK